ncbi:MAG: 2'-5' RNA ligase family protein [Bacteroidetes bacterium]|nr:2'-5' RNA ligase family protein [Bacteroidota bacterium]MBI3483155.1 2'-5' RNA ligase family protein [Bacteroidota bacterium]
MTNFFFLLVSPPPSILEDVSYFKNQVWKYIGHAYQSAHSKAHLTLLQYKDFHNESLLYTYHDAISRVKSFMINLKDFGFFKNNGTIFLKPYAPDLDELTRSLGHSITPHITIARNLKPIDFDVAWSVLKNLSYSNSFKCDCITVLKRINNKWQPHLDLPLA